MDYFGTGNDNGALFGEENKKERKIAEKATIAQNTMVIRKLFDNGEKRLSNIWRRVGKEEENS